jgi:hypothetical protein
VVHWTLRAVPVLRQCLCGHEPQELHCAHSCDRNVLIALDGRALDGT